MCSMDKMPYKWRIEEFLKENRITANLLAETISGSGVSRASVYNFVKNPESARVGTLSAIQDGLSKILKRQVSITEFAEYE
jgi:hypothetical protein